MDNQYFNLIKSWHIKATEEDYFTKFTFEYLAFTAFLHTQQYSEAEIQTQKGNIARVTDRDFIQRLKQDLQLNNIQGQNKNLLYMFLKDSLLYLSTFRI